MNGKTKVAKNTGWLVSAQITARILTALFIILLANHLLPSSFGIYNFAIAISYVFTVLADWGFDELTVREVSREPSKGPYILGNVLALRIILGLFTLTILFIVYYLVFDYVESSMPLDILILAGTMLVLEKLSNSFSAQFQAHERMELQAYVTIFWKLIYLGLGTLAIFLGYRLFLILVFLVVSYLIQLIFSLTVYLSKSPVPRISTPSAKYWKPLLKKASPFALFIFISVVYGHVIIVLLAILNGNYATGVYSASWKIIIFLGVVPYSFGRAIYPVFSRLYTSGKETLKHAYLDSLKYLLILSLPLTLGLTVIAGDITSLIYTNEYEETARVFATIVWMLPFLFMNGSLKMVLWSSHKTMKSSRNLGIASVVLVILGAFLIPEYGAYGASVAIVLAEIVHFITNYHLVSSDLTPVPLAHVWKPYSSALIMALILYLPELLNLNISPLWLLPPSMAVYFLILYLIKGLDRRDIRIIKEMLDKNR